MFPPRTVVLVNADFESRKGELSAEGPRAYEADAAVLDTARAVGDALRTLGVEVSELRVTSSLTPALSELERLGVRTVFNLVESLDNDYGREWEVPALLARHGVRCTGNGPRALRLCRTKDLARKALVEASVRVAPGFVVEGASALTPELVGSLRFPVFVKPARVDASIGIDASSRCVDELSLRAQLAKLEASLPGPFLVEEYLPGKEINVAIFPSPHDGLVVPTEIDFSPVPPEYPRFITYDSKWNPESPEYHSKSVPAELSPELCAEVEQLARRAFIALFGSGYGRVDMRLDAQGQPTVIDVNPNNDIHPDAGLAAAARSVGWDYPTLIARVLEHAHGRTLELFEETDEAP